MRSTQLFSSRSAAATSLLRVGRCGGPFNSSPTMDRSLVSGRWDSVDDLEELRNGPWEAVEAESLRAVTTNFLDSLETSLVVDAFSDH
jgi:hypothetical protein